MMKHGVDTSALSDEQVLVEHQKHRCTPFSELLHAFMAESEGHTVIPVEEHLQRALHRLRQPLTDAEIHTAQLVSSSHMAYVKEHALVTRIFGPGSARRFDLKKGRGLTYLERETSLALVNFKQITRDSIVCFLQQPKTPAFFHNHRAFLQEMNSEGIVQNAKWISSLMTSSVWTTVEGKEFSYEKHADGWRTRWLSELAVQKALTTVPLQVGGPGGGIVQLSTWEFRCVAANRCGRHFIEVVPILSGIQWGHSREELSKRWQKKWKPMFLRKHLDESHFLLPYRSKAAAASSQEGRCSDDMAFSLPASLMLLVHLANQKEQGEAFLKSFLTTFLEPCQVTLQAAGGRGRDGGGSQNITCLGCRLHFLRYDPSTGRYENRACAKEDIVDWDDLPEDIPAGPSAAAAVIEHSLWWPVWVLNLEGAGTDTDTVVAVICFYQLLELVMWAWLLRM
ncbi:hypothetical protein AK812_SmicGene26279 [Symbiodinium microadriaticum]|uniref:Uncharacterized protein n=1 Tax=Symbiodinium microadriaticum TaxID=2951 RepID=A0A1Q9DA04_SYMMI|nr:hypothetical protein AK812_SmicGene26279 [Symbiodinium microadriaticum]